MTLPEPNPLPNRSPAGSESDARLLFAEVLPSDIQLVEPVVERALAVLGHTGCLERQCVAAELSLREALANAILHGNGADPGKRVELDCYSHGDGSITIVVRDEGSGFDLNQVRDPTSPENVYRDGGRGIYLIRHFMDEVHFDRGGSEIRMRKGKDDGSPA